MSRAAELAKQLFEGIKDTANAIAPGLENFGAEVGAEMKRLNTQAGMELANALFNGHAFVPYGPGQYTPDVQKEPAPERVEEPAHEREGMSR